ncbi:hypothetical protein U3516DRAFT_771380 [Neocallimastix sp. 'constans']
MTIFLGYYPYQKNDSNKNNNTDSNNASLDKDTTQNQENDYEETSSSSSSVEIDDNDPMLLNIINMSINNYNKILIKKNNDCKDKDNDKNNTK